MMQWTYFLIWLFYQLPSISSMGTDENSTFGLPSVTTKYEDTYYVAPNRINFNLTCNATGNPTPSITWLKNGQSFPNTQKAQVTPTGVLVFTAGDSSILGTYQCKATNVYGASISPEVSISIAELGIFPLGQEKNVSKGRYQYLGVPCIDRPRCQPDSVCRFEWKRANGESIGSEKRIFVDNEGTLHFLYLEPDDQEQYACGIWNGQLNMHVRSPDQTILTVRSGDTLPSTYPPELVFNENVTGEAAQPARLQCAFSGHPLPDIVWLDTNGEAIEENAMYSFHDNRQTLVIGSLTDTHEGMYTCKGIQQSTGARAEGQVYLNVTGPPIFEAETMVDQVLTVGSDAHYSCLSWSLPNETLPETPVWYQDAREISIFGPDEKFSRNGTYLTVNKLEKNDTSCIQCMVRNSEGRNFREAQLVVIDPITVLEGLPEFVELTPNTPVSVRVTAITDPRLSLTYEWSALDNGRWTSLPAGVAVSDDQQSVTFTSSNVQEIVGVYRVVTRHAFDSVTLETNVVNRTVPSITTPATTRRVTSEAEGTTTVALEAETTTTTTTTVTSEAETTTVTSEAETTTVAEATTTENRINMTPTIPPKLSLEESTNTVPVAVIIVTIIIAIVVLAAIVIVVTRHRQRKGELVIDQPTMNFENTTAAGTLVVNTEESSAPSQVMHDRVQS